MLPLSNELACAYAALILQDEGVAVTGERISSILKAAGVKTEPIWSEMFVSALQNVDMKDLINDIGSGIGSAPAVAPAAAGAPVEESKGGAKANAKPAEEESDEEMGFSMFD